VQTMGRRPLPSAARVRPGAHSARHQDSRNDLTPCRMAWHFVSDGAHAPHSDQTLGPTPTCWGGALRSALTLPRFPVLASPRFFRESLLLMRKQGAEELFGVEVTQILDPLTDPNEPNGYPQLVGDGK